MILILYIILICYASFFNDFFPKTSFGAGVPDIDLFRALSYLLMLGSMFHWSIKKDLKIINRWILNLIIFYAIVFASVFWSNLAYDTRILRHLFEATFIPFFVAVLSFNLFKKEENSKIYLKHMTIAALILSSIAILQMVLQFLKKVEILRTTSAFTNPNTLAIILVLSIPCVIYTNEKKLLPKFLGLIATISVISGVISSVSRKGIITMILSFCLYNLFKKRYKSFLLTLILFLLLTAAFSGVPIIADRFESDSLTQTLEGKWEMTKAGLKMFISSPVIGLGFDGYKDHFNEYLPLSGKSRYDAHNMFITALANYGIIGFIPFIYIFFYPLKASFKAVRNTDTASENNHVANMAIICVVSVIPFMINGWFAGGLFYGPITLSILYSNISLFLSVND